MLPRKVLWRCSLSLQTRNYGLQVKRQIFDAVPSQRRQQRTYAEKDDKLKGVVPGLNQWPPKGFTEHGEPKPEDDPKNYNVVTGERTGGPSEGEIEKKKKEGNKDRPFSNPDRQGGTQRGGGGEGMSS